MSRKAGCYERRPRLCDLCGKAQRTGRIMTHVMLCVENVFAYRWLCGTCLKQRTKAIEKAGDVPPLRAHDTR